MSSQTERVLKIGQRGKVIGKSRVRVSLFFDSRGAIVYGLNIVVVLRIFIAKISLVKIRDIPSKK